MILSILANTTHHWVSPDSKTGFTIKSASKQRNHQLTIWPQYWPFGLRLDHSGTEYANESCYPSKQQLRSDLVNCAASGLPAREPTWCCVLASIPLTTNYSVPIFQINRKCSKLKIFCSVMSFGLLVEHWRSSNFPNIYSVQYMDNSQPSAKKSQYSKVSNIIK